MCRFDCIPKNNMAAAVVAIRNFTWYRVGTLVVVSGIIWYFRKSVKYYTHQKLFAWFMNKLTKRVNRELFKYKSHIFQCVKDRQERQNKGLSILEVGCGTAANLEFFPVNTKLVCLEPNPHFVGYIQKNLKQHDTVIAAEIIQGYAEDMPLEDERFDVAVSTLVLCSVSDIQKSLSEIKRVLKPGGVFVFLEHVAEHPHTWRHKFQRVMNPVHWLHRDGSQVSHSCVTEKYIEAAGFSSVKIESFYAKIMPFFTKPCIMGSATK